MSKEKFTWECNPDRDEWKALIEESPQGNIFCEQIFLDMSRAKYSLYFVRQGAELKAGVCVVEDVEGQNCVLNDLVIHNGIIFASNGKKSDVKRRYEEFSITEFVIDNLTEVYGSIQLSLAPQFEDLRPFLWYNYHETAQTEKFIPDLRYTSYVDISGLAGDLELEHTSTFLNMETLRRRHVRQALKQQSRTVKVSDCGDLVRHYQELMRLQEEPVSGIALSNIRHLIQGLVESNRCAVFETQNYDGETLYSVAYAWDSKRAYYLFGAGNPVTSEPWQGTIAHWEAFNNLACTNGITEIDLEGVNSPQRGWFKQGFGGDLRPYFHVFLQGNG